ncbi:hypothetical protein F2P81_019825 [Scophthalmus maximus]|uniref:Uncharacterized protein n=1 Tax=Scophthalmus maximus TaxID=52904 RepID=A0A6A4S8V7_SCOMX|nr:hypothetical protein F2P81_019825 [Scophthalmus maximus]
MKMEHRVVYMFIRLPPFYQGVFKSWAVVNQKRCPEADCLQWLLREPLIHGTRLDVSSNATPGLTEALIRSGTLTLKQLVDAGEPALSDGQALGASLLGLQSVRVAQRILELWAQRLSGKERSLLNTCYQEKTELDPSNPFPEIFLSPGYVSKLDDILLASPTEEDCKTDIIALLKFLAEQGHRVSKGATCSISYTTPEQDLIFVTIETSVMHDCAFVSTSLDHRALYYSKSIYANANRN